MFIYYFWDRDRAWTGEAQRERGDTESEMGSRLWAVRTEPDVGLEPTNCEIMTWVEVRPLTDWATQMPSVVYFINSTLAFVLEDIKWMDAFKSYGSEHVYCSASWKCHETIVYHHFPSLTFFSTVFICFLVCSFTVLTSFSHTHPNIHSEIDR